jgi:hypothetical protein
VVFDVSPAPFQGEQNSESYETNDGNAGIFQYSDISNRSFQPGQQTVIKRQTGTHSRRPGRN